MKKIAVDSWPLLAFFLGEPSAGRVENILLDSQLNEDRLLLTAVNAGEIWYSVKRAHSEPEADRILQEIRRMTISIVPADWPLTKIAARFKASGGLSYADCFAAALARQNNAPLVTGDPEFERLEEEIEIIWI